VEHVEQLEDFLKGFLRTYSDSRLLMVEPQ
jgi:hypothetical protein